MRCQVAAPSMLQRPDGDRYRSAALATGQPWSTIRRANRSRARGVEAALAWDTKTSWMKERFLTAPLHARRSLPFKHPQTVSSNNLDQRARSVQLVHARCGGD